MQLLSIADLQSLTDYETQRDRLRRQIIALKRIRRVAVGDVLSFVFENRETVLFQVHEMLRAERIVDPVCVQEELDVYNALIPAASELSATLFIEFGDKKRLQSDLPKLIGVDEAVSLRLGEFDIRGVSEPGRSTEEKTATVHYIRFPFTPAQRQAFVSGQGDVWLVIDHPGCGASARLSAETRQSLAADLQAA